MTRKTLKLILALVLSICDVVATCMDAPFLLVMFIAFLAVICYIYAQDTPDTD